jgi:Skp family chaperone for outer membrane proteins
LADQARRELSAQQQQFSKDVPQFQAASAGLTAQQRDTRAADLDKRQAALQASAQRREAQLGATTQDAFAAVDKVMAPILQETVKAHHGNMVLDRASLPYAQPSMDITPEVIAQLDAKMPSYKVTLAPAK